MIIIETISQAFSIFIFVGICIIIPLFILGVIVAIVCAIKKPKQKYTMPQTFVPVNTKPLTPPAVTRPAVPPKPAAAPQRMIYPYNRRHLLTNNEWVFYKRIKPIIDQNNMHIISKVRLADLVEVRPGFTYGEQQKWFAKIRSKHIDFAICDPENLQVKFLIEVQDSSHDKADRMERDKFVADVLQGCGYKICWIKNDGLLSVNLQNFINGLRQ